MNSWTTEMNAAIALAWLGKALCVLQYYPPLLIHLSHYRIPVCKPT